MILEDIVKEIHSIALFTNYMETTNYQINFKETLICITGDEIPKDELQLQLEKKEIRMINMVRLNLSQDNPSPKKTIRTNLAWVKPLSNETKKMDFDDINELICVHYDAKTNTLSDLHLEEKSSAHQIFHQIQKRISEYKEPENNGPNLPEILSHLDKEAKKVFIKELIEKSKQPKGDS